MPQRRHEAVEIADDVAFGEGPVWCDDSDTLVCTAVATGLLHRIWPDEGKSTVIADVGGGPNACAPAIGGGFLVTQNGGMDFAAFGLPGLTRSPRCGPESPRSFTSAWTAP